jgi:hypothetical protein
MNAAITFVALGLLALAAVAALFWPRGARRADRGAIAALSPEDLVLQHAKYFPLVRHALTGADLADFSGRIPRSTRLRVRRERHRVARSYLEGLREDYLRLERFGRLVAAHSPKVDARLEAQRVRIGARFRMTYAMVSMRLALGQVPVPAFEHMTQMLGSLATRLEASMAALVEPTPPQASADLGA